MALTDKEIARRIIDTLPDTASLSDITYAMYVRMKIDRGLHDAAQGDLIDDGEVLRDIDEWLASAGHS